MKPELVEIVNATLLETIKVTLGNMGCEEHQIVKFVAAATPRMCELLEDLYTSEELDELYKFHTSPVGLKGRALTSVLVEKGQKIGQDLSYLLV